MLVARAAIRRLWFRRFATIAILVFIGFTPLIPYVNTRSFIFGWALTSSMVGLSMNVLAGYAGQISLAQAVMYGTGAFAVGTLATRNGVPWLIAVPAAGLVTAGIALLVGLTALRIRGLNLAIVTLGFQFLMQRVVFRSKLFGGASGVDIERPELFGVRLEDHRLLWPILIVFVFIWFIDRNLTRSRAGRAFFAIRQDEQVAASFGVPVAKMKLLAFAISGFYAGLAGALFGTLQGDVSNELFDYIYSFEFLVFAVLGGLGSRAGTAIGGAFPILYRQLLTFLQTAGALLGGALLVITLLRYPGGLAAQGRELAHIARTFARRKVLGVSVFAACIVGSLVLAVVLPRLFRPVLHFVGLLVSKSTDWKTAMVLIAGIAILSIGTNISLAYAAKRLKLHTYPAHVTRPALPTPDVEAAALAFRSPMRDTSSEPLLVVENVTKTFGGVRALDGVSLEVRRGELIGIMGPNGSGKTTLLNNVSGFLTPSEGDIRIRGRSVLGMPPHARAALGIGRTFQNIGLVKQETVADNLLIAQHLVCRYGAMEGLLRTGGVVSEERRLRMRAAAIVEMLDLHDTLGERVSSLPHGRAKLVELGAALVTSPDLLLLDEPAAGVSPAEAESLGATLKDIAEQFGVTILMIEHHVPLMLSTCDYIYVLNFGKMLTAGEPMEVAAHPDVIAAYLGSVGEEASRAVAAGH